MWQNFLLVDIPIGGIIKCSEGDKVFWDSPNGPGWPKYYLCPFGCARLWEEEEEMAVQTAM